MPRRPPGSQAESPGSSAHCRSMPGQPLRREQPLRPGAKTFTNATSYDYIRAASQRRRPPPVVVLATHLLPEVNTHTRSQTASTGSSASTVTHEFGRSGFRTNRKYGTTHDIGARDRSRGRRRKAHQAAIRHHPGRHAQSANPLTAEVSLNRHSNVRPYVFTDRHILCLDSTVREFVGYVREQT